MKRPFFALLFFSCVLAAFSQKTYKRIISLAPSITQSLYFMGAQDKLVGCTSYCLAAKGDNVPVVSSAVKMNIEKILAQKPDLVIGSGLTNPKDIETLKKFGVAVEIFSTPKNFDEICAQFLYLGELAGTKLKADAIVKESKNEVTEIARRKDKNKAKKIFFQIGADPIFAVLDQTFMDDYITLLGATNVAKGLKQGAVGREFVIAENPDYIFIATMGIVGDEEKAIWQKYTSINATKQNNIFIIDSEIACQPTPVTFVQTIKIIAEKVNKK